MDSWEGLLEGGEEAAALVPGDVKESFMIEVLHLPKDDDYHMPPPKKDQMEAHEIELLEWWVALIVASDVGQAFLGSQGDIWDAQWDMLLALIGAMVALPIFSRLHDRSMARLGRDHPEMKHLLGPVT